MKDTAARIGEACEALASGREMLSGLLGRAHPLPGCLPVPELRVPADRTGIAEAGTEMYANLFTEHGHRATSWIAARTSCTHLPAEQVNQIHSLLCCWYRFLLSAARHVEDENKYSPFDLDWCAARLAEEIAAVDAEVRDAC
ncbi:hypothetical protein [Amycolatopsis sp. NPDC004079]|uniref:hypothetical protein n=1 Tax=Amycolatopsis sp. NPDC004079 TaxID=3154549 RepID=UPI0033A279DF